MMKCLHKHIARLAVALCLLPVSCVKEMPFQEEGPSGALYLQPGAVELTTKTTAGDDDRGENALGTYLDVFFTGDDSFWKEYHLTDRSFASAKGELLSVNWRADGFDPDKEYNVYVLVNGPDAAHGTVGSFSALQAITVTDADIYRLQRKTGDRAAEEPHAYTSGAKRFVMDGYLDSSWSPDGSKTVQTIDMSASLRRAAAKIVLNVSYDADFLAEIIADEKTPQEPRFKLNNYAACSAAITDGDAVDPALATTGGWRRLNGYVEPAPDPVYNYSLTTYSYAFSWGTSAAAVGLDAPYIILSVPLGDDPAKVVNHYYRIPVRPQDVYSLERNTIYTINVVLNSLGSYKETDAEIPVNLSYQVLEWTKIGSEVTNVETEAVHFFQVSPTEVALRGDGAQSQTFRYYAPTDASITIEAIPTDPTNELDVEATARSFTDTQTIGGYGYQALYIDKDDNPRASSVDDIVLNTTAGTITVTSTALANRASKYIRFRVWYDKGETWQKYQDIYIRHFPTDNISSISGWYSYKYDGSTRREYSWDPETDGWVEEGWDKWEDYTDEYCPDENTYTNAYHKYDLEGPVSASSTPNWKNYDHNVSREEFVTAVPNKINSYYIDRSTFNRRVNSENNAEQGVSGSGYESYYYWGGNNSSDYTTTTGQWLSRPDEALYDWADAFILSFNPRIEFYTWNHINKYWYVKGKARRYYRDVPVYSWVRWIPDSQTNYTGTKITGDSYMNAKVYENGKFYRINAPANGRATLGATTTHKNNHMYVIQLTASSENYVMGRPIINTSTHFSDDHVVSPAFMLASQLGACDVSGLGDNPDVAATHCTQYVEASKISSTTSKVYTGWRLPTYEELTIIKNIQDQNYDTFDKVITVGNYYFTLEGSRHAIGALDNPGHFVRCVRDLTPEELTELNKVK